MTEQAMTFHDVLTTEDIPLATLSDDEYEALWTAERLEVDPDAAPRMGSGLRGLMAHGYAAAQPDGSVLLEGAVGLIRASRTANLGHVVVRDASGEHRWFVVEPGVVLEQRAVPGGLEFVVRDLKRAVRELADGVVPAGTTEGEPWSFGPDDDRRWQELAAAHPTTTQVLAVRPVLGTDDWVGQLLTLVTDGASPGWAAFTDWQRHTSVRPARRGSVRRLLQDLIGGSGLAIDLPPAETS